MHERDFNSSGDGSAVEALSPVRIYKLDASFALNGSNSFNCPSSAGSGRCSSSRAFVWLGGGAVDNENEVDTGSVISGRDDGSDEASLSKNAVLVCSRLDGDVCASFGVRMTTFHDDGEETEENRNY